MNNYISIHSTKKSRIVGISVSAALMVVIMILNNSFVKSEFKSRWLLFSAAYALTLLIGLFCAFKVTVKKPVIGKAAFAAGFIIFPLFTIVMTECLNRIWVYDMTVQGFFGNLLVVLLFYFCVYALTGSLRVSVFSVTSVFYILALIHAYVVSFRGTPFLPMDLLGTATALNVGSTYDYTPSEVVILGTLLYAAIIILAAKTTTPHFTVKTKLIARTFTGMIFAVMVFIFYFTEAFPNAGIKPDFWNQTRGYKNYGFVYNFVCNTRYVYYPKPKDYSAEKTHEYVTNKSKEYKPDPTEEKKPNIICIMNESLADLEILGEVQTNEDCMPYIRSLKENTIRGNLYVPVIGAGTSNTEFEFLTGHSTAFLPSGSNAYMLYIKNPIASMVSTLTAQGYSSAAFHPYFASGWNRTDVYKNMGFNIFKSIENLLDTSILEQYVKNCSDPDFLQDLITETYPDRANMLLRQYVSDEYDYRVIIDEFNNRDKSKPYYMFNVTMQNHGGYLTRAKNFTTDIFLTSEGSDAYVKTNNYLSLVKKSDDAFKMLIEYFKTVDEPTVICMFGDHQPSIESEFIAQTLGVSDLSKISIEQDQARHVTPFIIWANYDIEEQEIDKLSSNYLSSLVLKTANVQLTEYNKYLLELSKVLPVIDTVGYIDKDNNYYKWSDFSDYSDLLKEYELIQYNNIFDYENNDNKSFFINDYSVEDIAAAIQDEIPDGTEDK